VNCAKVGIVIPAYNAARYIAHCLESALAQDYPNLHVYVVDDASTDNTCEVVAQVVERFPGRVTWRTREDNRGGGFTRQEATELALSDECSYIAPLDADDIRKPNTIGRQVEVLESSRDLGVCYAKTDFIHGSGAPVAGPGWERLAALLNGVPQGEVWDHLITHGKIGTMDTIVIRDVVARACRYETAFHYLEDLDYQAQIATLPNTSRFAALDEVVASYRFHSHQSVDRIKQQDFVRLVYQTTRKIALRVFWRLQQQSRAVPPRRRRHLWRLLSLRVMLNALRHGTWGDLPSLVMNVLMPIERLEAEFRAGESESLREVLGVWARNGEAL
jgi:glycosyltransferase involved in cell wall biosynthesis